MKKRDLILIGLLLMLLATVMSWPHNIPGAAASAWCGTMIPLSGMVEQTAASALCYQFIVPSNSSFLRIKLEPSRGTIDLYLKESLANFLSDEDKVNTGEIDGKVTYVLLEPQPGPHTIAVVPTRGDSEFSLNASTMGVASAASSRPTQSCSGSVCSSSYPLTSGEAAVGDAIELGSDFGDQVIFPIKIGSPGRVEARATWSGTASNLALILNGPDRPELPNPVAYYAREDGGSPLTLTYNITADDFHRGRKWRVRLVNFSGGQATGNVEITYPGVIHSVSAVVLNPPSPAGLRFGQEVSITFNYSTNEAGGVRIFARPFANGALAPNYAASGSPLYPAGEGSGSGNFTITSGEVTVDQIRFQMWNADQSSLLHESFIPVNYRFSDHTAGLTAPKQISPANGTVFHHYPRTTTLQWSAVPGADKYTVEVDCYHCCQANRWCTDVGQTWKLVPNIYGTSYTFDFVGAQPGRWRVWAVDVHGREGPKSEWWEFQYTQ